MRPDKPDQFFCPFATPTKLVFERPLVKMKKAVNRALCMIYIIGLAWDYDRLIL